MRRLAVLLAAVAVLATGGTSGANNWPKPLPEHVMVCGRVGAERVLLRSKNGIPEHQDVGVSASVSGKNVEGALIEGRVTVEFFAHGVILIANAPEGGLLTVTAANARGAGTAKFCVRVFWPVVPDVTIEP